MEKTLVSIPLDDDDGEQHIPDSVSVIVEEEEEPDWDMRRASTKSAPDVNQDDSFASMEPTLTAPTHEESGGSVAVGLNPPLSHNKRNLSTLSLASENGDNSLVTDSGQTFPMIARNSDKWLADEKAFDCKSCDLPFTFFRRKHHCRLCGYVFCKKCCPVRGITRVCDECIHKVSMAEFDGERKEDLNDQEVYLRQLRHLAGADAFPFPYKGPLLTRDAVTVQCGNCIREVEKHENDTAFRCGLCGAVNNLLSNHGLGLDKGLPLSTPEGYVDWPFPVDKSIQSRTDSLGCPPTPV